MGRALLPRAWKRFRRPPEHLLMLVPTRAVVPTLQQAAPLGCQGGHHLQRRLRRGHRSQEPRALAASWPSSARRAASSAAAPNCMGAASVNQRMMTYAQRQPLLKPGPRGRRFPERRLLGQLDEGGGGARRRLQLRHLQRQRGEPGRRRLHVLSHRPMPTRRSSLLMVEGIRRPQMFLEMAAPCAGSRQGRLSW